MHVLHACNTSGRGVDDKVKSIGSEPRPRVHVVGWKTFIFQNTSSNCQMGCFAMAAHCGLITYRKKSARFF